MIQRGIRNNTRVKSTRSEATAKQARKNPGSDDDAGGSDGMSWLIGQASTVGHSDPQMRSGRSAGSSELHGPAFSRPRVLHDRCLGKIRLIAFGDVLNPFRLRF